MSELLTENIIEIPKMAGRRLTDFDRWLDTKAYSQG
jgi:hypothetical protein